MTRATNLSMNMSHLLVMSRSSGRIDVNMLSVIPASIAPRKVSLVAAKFSTGTQKISEWTITVQLSNPSHMATCFRMGDLFCNAKVVASADASSTKWNGLMFVPALAPCYKALRMHPLLSRMRPLSFGSSRSQNATQAWASAMPDKRATRIKPLSSCNRL